MSEKIFCVSCDKEVQAVAMLGNHIYPHREDLYSRKFYQCPYCGNYVGTHQDGRPLGTIPTPELRIARNEVHRIIDEYWLPTKDRRKRKELYAELSELIGRRYHTAELNTIAECKEVIEYYQQHYE